MCDPFAATCKLHVRLRRLYRIYLPSSKRNVVSRRVASQRGRIELYRSGGTSRVVPGRKIPPRLYLFSTFFFPSRGRATARAREPLLSLSPSALLFPLFPLHFLVPPSFLYLSLSSILRAANAPAIPPSLPPCARHVPSPTHFVFGSKCGIQQGFPRCLRWCGIRAPVCRYARGPGELGVHRGK